MAPTLIKTSFHVCSVENDVCWVRRFSEGFRLVKNVCCVRRFSGGFRLVGNVRTGSEDNWSVNDNGLAINRELFVEKVCAGSDDWSVENVCNGSNDNICAGSVDDWSVDNVCAGSVNDSFFLFV